MATKTSYLKLDKPEASDLIADFRGQYNGNLDAIDGEMSQRFIRFESEDTTWAGIWAKLEGLQSGETALVYAKAAAVSALTGGAVTTASETAGTIANCGSGNYQMSLVVMSSGKFHFDISLTGASESGAGTVTSHRLSRNISLVVGMNSWAPIWDELKKLSNGEVVPIYCQKTPLGIMMGDQVVGHSCSGIVGRYTTSQYTFLLTEHETGSHVSFNLAGVSEDGPGTCTVVDMTNQTHATTTMLNGVDLLDTSIKPGFYYCTGEGQYSPDGAGPGYLEIFARGDAANRIRIVKWRAYNSNKEYVNVLQNSETAWKGWYCLQDNVWSFDAPTLIPDGTDMNTVTTHGNYYVYTSSHAETMINPPLTNTGFLMRVERGADSSNVTQIAYGVQGTGFAIRRVTIGATGNTATAWRTYAMKSELDAVNEKLTSGSELTVGAVSGVTLDSGTITAAHVGAVVMVRVNGVSTPNATDNWTNIGAISSAAYRPSETIYFPVIYGTGRPVTCLRARITSAGIISVWGLTTAQTAGSTVFGTVTYIAGM